MQTKAATMLFLYLRNTSALITFGFGIRDVEEEVVSFGKLVDVVVVEEEEIVAAEKSQRRLNCGLSTRRLRSLFSGIAGML